MPTNIVATKCTVYLYASTYIMFRFLKFINELYSEVTKRNDKTIKLKNILNQIETVFFMYIYVMIQFIYLMVNENLKRFCDFCAL